MIRDIVNVLSIFWARNTARKLVGNILNVLMMYQLGFSQVHCLCLYNVFTMSWVRKLGFAPSVSNILHIKDIPCCFLLQSKLNKKQFSFSTMKGSITIQFEKHTFFGHLIADLYTVTMYVDKPLGTHSLSLADTLPITT